MILYRYVVREFMRPFLYALSTIMSLFMMQLAIKLLPRVLYKGVPISVVVELFAVNLAHIAVLSVPMSTLIATLMVFGKLSSDNEITAIKAGGRSVASLIPPVVAISGLISVFMLFFNTAVLPEANHHSSALLSDIMRKKPAAMIQPGILIRDFPNYAIMVDSVENKKGQLFGIKIFSEQSGRTPSVTVAKEGTVFLTSDENFIELKLFNGEVHTNGGYGSKEHYRVDFDTQIVYIENIDSKLTRSDNDSRGEREKTNDQLLQEVKTFRDFRKELQNEHDTMIDGLLAVTDSLVIPVNSAQLAKDSIAEVQKKFRASSISMGKGKGKRSRNYYVSAAVSDSMAKDTTLSEYRKLIHQIEADGRGARVSRLAYSELNRADVRNSRIKNQDEQINSYMVEVHKKYALAAAIIVFALLGVPLGVISRSGSVAISVSYSLVFFIIYYAFLMAGEKMSEVKGIPAALAMWSGNALLLALAIFLIGRATRETSFVNWGWIKTLGLKYTRQNALELAAQVIVDSEVNGSLPKPKKKKSAIALLLGVIRFPFVAFGKIVTFPGFVMKQVVRLLMPKLPAYILGRFVSFFLTVTLGLIIMTVVIDYVSMINMLTGAKPKELVMYYLYFMAWFLSIILPMALLLATMMTIGSFARTNELTAIKASGISMVKMTIPLLFVGVFMSIFSFFFVEHVLPDANKKRDLLKDTFSARRNNQEIPDGIKTYKHDFYYFSNPTTAYRFTHFQTSPPRGDQVIRYRFGDGTLLETTEMKKMEFVDSSWIMYDGVRRDFTRSGGYKGKRFSETADSYIKDTPEEMVQTVSVAEELSHGELQMIMEKGRQRGEDVSKYEADLQFKFALPLMNFIMILIGVAVTARSDKRGGAVYFGVGLLLVLLYWAVAQFLLVFGRTGQLSPAFAAWGGTVLFLIIGLLMYRKASQ